MSRSGVGVLLALSGEDSEILRVLNGAGSAMTVVRRCADLPELLSAGMAGLAPLALLDTGFDEVDRTVLDRLGRAGLSGVLLVDPAEQGRWETAGWPVERRDAPPERICTLLRSVARAHAAGPGGPTLTGGSEEPGGRAAQEGQPGTQVPGGHDQEPMTAAEETRWLEEMWRRSSAGPSGEVAAATDGPGPDRPGAVPAGPSREPGAWGPEPQEGRIVVVWGTHGAPGRSTVAASLAHGLARAGGAVLVDADVEAPCLVQLLGMPDDSSALAGAARLATHGRLDAESFQALLAPVGDGLLLLGGLGRAGRWRELPPPSMSEVWRQCRRTAAWTVVDVAGGALDDETDGFTFEPGRTAVAAELVASADVVVVVGVADPVGVRRLLQLLGDVRGLSQDGATGGAGPGTAPAGRVEVVVNRVRASAAGPSPQRALREAMERYGGLDQVVLLPEDAASADRCLLQGRSVLEGAPASELGRALAALVDRVDPRSGARASARGRSAARRLGSLGSALRSAAGVRRRPPRSAGEPAPRVVLPPAAQPRSVPPPPPPPPSGPVPLPASPPSGPAPHQQAVQARQGARASRARRAGRHRQ